MGRYERCGHECPSRGTGRRIRLGDELLCGECVVDILTSKKPPTGGEDDMDPNELGRYPDEKVGHQ